MTSICLFITLIFLTCSLGVKFSGLLEIPEDQKQGVLLQDPNWLLVSGAHACLEAGVNVFEHLVQVEFVGFIFLTRDKNDVVQADGFNVETVGEIAVFLSQKLLGVLVP